MEDIEITQDSVHIRWEKGLPSHVVIRNDRIRIPAVFRLEAAPAEELASLLGPLQK